MVTRTLQIASKRQLSGAQLCLRAAMCAACLIGAPKIASAETVQLIIDIGGGTQQRSLSAASDTVRVITVPAATATSAIEALQNDPDIAHVEVDGRVFPTFFDDPWWPEQWALSHSDSTPAGTDLENAWLPEHAKARITVAVVDTGILLDHIDVGETLPGYDFVSEFNTANDGDGRDANPDDPGDWVSAFDVSNAVVSHNCPIQNSTWHGTGVTGVLAAKRNNGTGIAGAAQNIDILPVRVMGKCGGRVSDLIAGIRWAAGLAVYGVPDNPNPAQIINLSLGIDQACTPAIQKAIDDAKRAGAMVIAASGNGATNMDLTPQAPASCDGVFTVAASRRDGSLSSYSNYGGAVDLMAPGGEPNDGVVTTQDSGTQAPVGDHDYGPRYGTSIATPHVSATAAMMLAVNPLLSDEVIAATLQQTSNRFPSQCTGCGAGLLDASEAVRVAAGLADSPLPATDGSANSISQTSLSTGSGSLSIWLGVVLLAVARLGAGSRRRVRAACDC